MIEPDLIATAVGGTLRAGDIITFEGVLYWPWYKRIWLHLRYMRHNNPMFKPKELRQFVVSWSNDSAVQHKII